MRSKVQRLPVKLTGFQKGKKVDLPMFSIVFATSSNPVSGSGLDS
jgi:hypothetical protein